VFRSTTDGETHTQLRAHWATTYPTRLAALHPKATPTPGTPAPRPVVQRATAVTGVKKSAPATAGPVRRTPTAPKPPRVPRTAPLPCATLMTRGPHAGQPCGTPSAGGTSTCSNHARTGRTRPPKPYPPRPVCGLDGCDQLARQQTVPGPTPLYCTPQHKEQARANRHGDTTRADRPTTCSRPGCDEPLQQAPTGRARLYCSTRCNRAAARQRDTTKAAA
jgi:hypothetical protein